MLRLAVAWFLVAAWSHARADAPWANGVEDAQKQAATRLLDAGNVLFLERRYSDALAKYREAVASWDHPAIRFNIVRCLIQLERPVEAADNLALALRYGKAPLEEAVYTEAIAYQKLLAKQISEVEIRCSQEGVELTLDGQPLATCPAAVTRKLPPGRHQLVGTKPGLTTNATELVLVGSETRRVEMRLGPSVAQPLGMRFVGKVVMYSGGGLLLVAGGLGLFAWRTYHAQFPDRCTENPDGGRPLCDSTGVSALDRARTFSDIATVTTVVGAGLAITGAIVWWRAPGERRVTLAPSSGGATVVVGGTF